MNGYTELFTPSRLYEVLNSVAIDAVLVKAKSNEVDLAVEHLAHTTTEDLLIEDRGYVSYEMLAQANHANRHIVICCSAASFSVARKMLKGEGKESPITPQGKRI